MIEKLKLNSREFLGVLQPILHHLSHTSPFQRALGHKEVIKEVEGTTTVLQEYAEGEAAVCKEVRMSALLSL